MMISCHEAGCQSVWTGVLMSGSLADLYLKNQTNEVFWLVVGIIVIILFACFVLMSKIEIHLYFFSFGFWEIIEG
uniref:Uncharacterized protein n=1 Tax=Candidatus Kentrum sp. LPFa TaxID=2126335 RepID=A0A450X2J4_9GAMM|nr:MAG: hypothetical protein BECKLPF1236B_GA0070989_13621 [Candidatus Kentron sp. LPFa]